MTSTPSMDLREELETKPDLLTGLTRYGMSWRAFEVELLSDDTGLMLATRRSRVVLGRHG